MEFNNIFIINYLLIIYIYIATYETMANLQSQFMFCYNSYIAKK